MTESLNGVPNGWVESPIEGIFAPLEDGRTLHHGWSPQCETGPSELEDEWGALKTTAIQAGAFLPEHNKRLPANLSPRPILEVRTGDIVITCAGPRSRCGVACLVRSTRPRLMISGKMYRFRVPVEAIDPRFVEAFLQTNEAGLLIDQMKTGGSDSGLNLTHDRFRRLTVRVAPFNEQQRIVEEIEKQFTRLDAGVAALKRVEANLRRYKAVVLKAAVEGRLTQRWRTEHPDVEPASELLKRILTERRRRWEQSELAKMRAKGKPPTDERWKKKYKEPIAPDADAISPLPKGWTWATAEQLSDETRAITYGVVKLGEPVDDGVPTLRSSNVRHLGLELGGMKRISPGIADNYRRTYLQGGEILITVRGSLGGIVCCLESCAGFNISREVAMMALVDPSVGPAAALFIASTPIQGWLARHTRGIAYTGINIETLKRMPIPLPPIEEQRVIVEIVDNLLSLAAAVHKSVAANRLRASRLRQSILKRAFAGKLVPQDPTDEPASVLLDRIRAERANGPQPRGRQRGTKQGKTGRKMKPAGMRQERH